MKVVALLEEDVEDVAGEEVAGVAEEAVPEMELGREAHPLAGIIARQQAADDHHDRNGNYEGVRAEFETGEGDAEDGDAQGLDAGDYGPGGSACRRGGGR